MRLSDATVRLSASARLAGRSVAAAVPGVGVAAITNGLGASALAAGSADLRGSPSTESVPLGKLTWGMGSLV